MNKRKKEYLIIAICMASTAVAMFIAFKYGEMGKEIKETYQSISKTISKTISKQSKESDKRPILSFEKLDQLSLKLSNSVNDLQSSKVLDEIDQYTENCRIQNWRGKITTLNKYEIKIDCGGTWWFYTNMNSELEEQVGYWKVGDIVDVSGEIGKTAIISRYLNITSISN